MDSPEAPAGALPAETAGTIRKRNWLEGPRDLSVDAAAFPGSLDPNGVAEFEEPGTHQVLAHQTELGMFADLPGQNGIQPDVAGDRSIRHPLVPPKSVVPRQLSREIEKRANLKAVPRRVFRERYRRCVSRAGVQPHVDVDGGPGGSEPPARVHIPIESQFAAVVGGMAQVGINQRCFDDDPGRPGTHHKALRLNG